MKARKRFCSPPTVLENSARWIQIPTRKATGTDEARRYYIGIVGKYGAQVQAVLKKAAGLDIQTICPLHGPVLKENLGHYLNKYHIWSSYAAETEGILIAYTSVYGNTKKAAELFSRPAEVQGLPAGCSP